MAKTLQPGNLISHYRVIGPLGEGGMGEVYLAHDLTLERNVALKVLPADLVRNQERVRRFVLEAKSASSLSHPHIVTIHEIGQDRVRVDEGDTTPAEGSAPIHFIAMELISGQTLGDKIHHEKTDLRTLLGYLAQVAEGLAKAHAAGIVHRDLKPNNIMITKDGYAKVLDFGLAKLTEKQAGTGEITSAPTEAANLTRETAVVGTVGYMSPEQVRGKTVDHRSDIFSFGCILYEATTRQRPFLADSDVETMNKILNDRPQAVEELNAQAPADVRRLIRRCLAKNPDQRFQSILDVAIELREIVDDYDSLSASASSGSSSGSVESSVPPPRRRGLIAGIAAVALFGVVGLVVGIYGLRRGRADATIGQEPFQSMRMTSLMSRGDIGSYVLSSDGRYLGYVVGSKGQSSVRVRQLSTGSDVEIVPPQDTSLMDLTFGPNGDYLYYLAVVPETPNYRALFEVPTLGGTSRKRAFDVDCPVAFSPDGARIAFVRGVTTHGENHLVIRDLASGEERILAKIKDPQELLKTRPSWSPDGKKIAGVIRSAEGGLRWEVVAFDVGDGSHQPIGQHVPLIFSVAWLAGGDLAVVGIDVASGLRPQVWLLSYPIGQLSRLTNDLNDYGEVSASADGKTIASLRMSRISNLWVASTGGEGVPRQLTHAAGSGERIDSLAVADGGSLFFQSGSGRSLWTMKSDGTARRQIELGGRLIGGYRLIPGGLGVVMTGFDKDLVPHVWRADLDGGSPTQLTKGSGEVLLVQPDIPADGRWALCRKTDDSAALWRLPLDGGELSLITQDNGGQLVPPDGKHLAVTRSKEVAGRQVGRWAILPADGGEPISELVPPQRAGSLRWTPDGTALSYMEQADSFCSISRWPIAGGEARQVFRFSDGRINGYRWSPDGRRILFKASNDQGENVWTVSLPSGKPERLTDFKTGSVYDLAWARDGKSAFFTQGEDSSDVVLIQGFDRPADGRR